MVVLNPYMTVYRDSALHTAEAVTALNRRDDAPFIHRRTDRTPGEDVRDANRLAALEKAADGLPLVFGATGGTLAAGALAALASPVLDADASEVLCAAVDVLRAAATGGKGGCGGSGRGSHEGAARGGAARRLRVGDG